MLRPRQHQQVVIDWVGAKQAKLDMAFSVHVPDSATGTGAGRDDIWLSKKLSRYFAGLDERALRRTSQTKIERLVVLHHSPDVGWHAHFQMATPMHMSQLELLRLAAKLWKRALGPHYNCKVKRRLFWGQPVVGAHLPYMLDHLSINTIDWENTHFTSSIGQDQTIALSCGAPALEIA